ncbi:hypothetical protein OH710_25760 [Pseudomonas capsici]|uniref:hypothetical protein n=1 Tax=Pseudomonas capsici TaxID=2810614 RepID=UPI0019104B9F|nr:hypothetical protein [Pseudomonas capsici]MBX8612127.1 hypothetical protein [Pseudomonas cichorii]MCV4276053.1 hypothetical protein [Pseudomonas capsici]GFM72049.1 hypothetical protein PSCICL_30410 [Pseudomonas cichorii]
MFIFKYLAWSVVTGTDDAACMPELFQEKILIKQWFVFDLRALDIAFCNDGFLG